MSVQKQTTHTAFKELPIVDISQLFSEDLSDRKIAAASLDKAVRAAGFFYLQGHGITPALINDLKRETKHYFAQDIEQKMKNYIGLSDNHTGYVPQGEEQFYSHAVNNINADLKEAYDVGPDSPSLMARFTDTASAQLPDNEPCQKAIQAYYQAMLSLSETLFKGFALALELDEGTFTQHLSTPPSQLRLIHYFDNPNAKETDSGIGAHTDYEFFTILLPTAPGLQVLNGAGEWISVPIIEDCFVINIGDMMELVTNGQYVATSHRVRQVKEERYAFPFFSSLDYDTEVAPLAEFLTGDEPSTYEPLICGDHLLAQTMQTFSYLKQRLEKGEIQLPEKSQSLLSFGQASIKQG